MLVLTRKPGEVIHIGDDITVKVLRVNGGRVRIAIDAPRELPIQRGELVEVTMTTPTDVATAETAA